MLVYSLWGWEGVFWTAVIVVFAVVLLELFVFRKSSRPKPPEKPGPEAQRIIEQLDEEEL
jgi:predicted MFS family arabinose efflux permease